MKLAQNMTLSSKTGRVTIDGIDFPFYTHADGPEVDAASSTMPVATVWLGILIDGCVTLEGPESTAVYDSELGDVGEWARNLVRAGLIAKSPWLALPTAA